MRLQVSFTVAPHAFDAGARQLVQRLGGSVLLWSQAVRERFDLALAAGSQGIEQLRAPVVLLSHGARRLKLERAVLPSRLVAELPRPGHRVAVPVHPNVWARHGTWRVRAWLAGWRHAGVTLLPPEQDWRQPLIAADWIIGDFGSVTLYGTMTGVPILLSRAGSVVRCDCD